MKEVLLYHDQTLQINSPMPRISRVWLPWQLNPDAQPTKCDGDEAEKDLEKKKINVNMKF